MASSEVGDVIVKSQASNQVEGITGVTGVHGMCVWEEVLCVTCVYVYS